MLRALKIVMIVALVAAVLGLVIQGLWNWLMPSLFGLHGISFWQSLGLLLLCKILFGGFHRHPSRQGCWRRRMKERLDDMSPEEREKFRRMVRDCCTGREAAVESNR
jgi:Ca2+/H+ antiporter, TMEM165/GDT1 family